MTAFLDNFDPFRHDVLYGLQAPRESYCPVAEIRFAIRSTF